MRWPGDVHDVVDPPEQPEVAVLVDPGAVAREVHPREALPVRGAEARVVAEDPARHRRPWPLQHQVATAARGRPRCPWSSTTAASTPGNGFVAAPGLIVVTPGSGVMHDHPGLRLPPGVDDGQTIGADVLAVPDPRLRVDRLADGSEQPERREVVLRRVLRPPLHVRPDRRRRRVQDRDAVALDDVPPAILVGEVGRALVEDARRAVAERPVDDVAVSGDPADVRRAPVDVGVRLQVEDVVVGGRRADQIARGRVSDALRLRGRPARVQEVEKVFRVHRLAGTRGGVRGLALDELGPAEVASFGHRHLGARPLTDDDLPDPRTRLERFVRVLLERAPSVRAASPRPGSGGSRSACRSADRRAPRRRSLRTRRCAARRGARTRASPPAGPGPCPCRCRPGCPCRLRAPSARSRP